MYQDTITGNHAAAYVAYGLTDVCVLFPITPASPMGEVVDTWAGMGKKNCFNQVVSVTQMQSEAGVAGALHGVVAAGSLGSSFTSSQGLLLMIPDMYRIAGCLYPSVIHVATRAVSTQGWNIMGDHSDVMACRQTGWAMLSSHNVQQCHDLAVVSHIASLKTRLPFLHFFEGFQLSHQVAKIDMLSYDEMKPLIPVEKVVEHRELALNPNRPSLRGLIQNQDIYMQKLMINNKWYLDAADVVEECMREFEKLTGRAYHNFKYVGHHEAERVVVIMGAVSDIAVETVNYILKGGPDEKVGVLAVHLYRPWSRKHFLLRLPNTTKFITVLNRSHEPGAENEPLSLDVISTVHAYCSEEQLQSYGWTRAGLSGVQVLQGQYGMGGKYCTPREIMGVFQNMSQPKPMQRFTLGLVDDVFHMNLPSAPYFSSVAEGTTQCTFWGLGSDGTVGANIQAIKIIGTGTDLHAQGNFEYDSHKSGGVTKSHLRFGTTQITSHYAIDESDYIAVHHPSFAHKFDVLRGIKPNGVFVMNWSLANAEMPELEASLPASFRRGVAEKNIQLYLIDAFGLASALGLGNKINMIMQALFFKLFGVLPVSKAIPMLKDAIQKMYGKKGDTIVKMNILAVDKGLTESRRISYDVERWLKAEQIVRIPDILPKNPTAMVDRIMKPVAQQQGDLLPISKFVEGGYCPPGLSQYEKRGVAIKIPKWKSELCTQCNECSVVCAHGAIRPALVTAEELDNAPVNPQGDDISTLKAKLPGSTTQGLAFRIQVSPYDCTGCELCSKWCAEGALQMEPFVPFGSKLDDPDQAAVEYQQKLFEYFNKTLPPKPTLMDKYTIKGSQFQEPLMEFSGACEGCAETQYIKLLTQLYGDRMSIAASAGCSVVICGWYPFASYKPNREGRGPAHGFSLFEDTAEYGFGMTMADKQTRYRVHQLIEATLDPTKGVPISDELKASMEGWMAGWQDGALATQYGDIMSKLLEAERKHHQLLAQLYQLRDVFPKISHWVIGGDGWAYDIGYGGLDHVLSQKEDINILILDNEVYSNTGGQKSKGTPMGAVAKFAAFGKRTQKKELGVLLMNQKDVYVASVAMHHNLSQTMKAFREAEAYQGPSVIIAYSPCIAHGIAGGLKTSKEHVKQAVESGYWNLYRYNPDLQKQGKSPLQLDSKRLTGDLLAFLKTETRFESLMRAKPAVAQPLQADMLAHVQDRHHLLQAQVKSFENLRSGLSAGETEAPPDMSVLFISDTGNAEGVAERITSAATDRGLKTRCIEANEIEQIDDLLQSGTVVVVASTCGQGEVPANGRSFVDALVAAMKDEDTKDLLKGVSFGVFGLGDSGYVFFNKTAKTVERCMLALGATCVLETGNGDDQDPDMYETALDDWIPELWTSVGAPNDVIGVTPGPKDPSHAVETIAQHGPVPSGTMIQNGVFVPAGATLIPLTKNELLTPEKYDRDIRHYEFGLSDSQLRYDLGDALSVYPRNEERDVDAFLNMYDLKPEEVVSITPPVGKTSKYPPKISVKQLFTQVIDIFGRPSRRFVRELAVFAEDPEHKKMLEHYAGCDGKTDFTAEITDKMWTYADLLETFHSARPCLAHLLDLVPPIRPRFYSIASSYVVDPKKIELCIVQVDWEGGPEAKARTGLCTTFLKNLAIGGQLAVAISPSSFGVLPANTDPVLMAGLGTGMAPYRAMIQYRAWLKHQGKPAGELTLYYGCRHEATEFLYGDWLRQMESEGVVRLRPAFSRDQSYKIYVTDKLAADSKYVANKMMMEDGFLMYCGPAGRHVDDVSKSVSRALVAHHHAASESQALEMITEWRVRGRYVVEAW